MQIIICVTGEIFCNHFCVINITIEMRGRKQKRWITFYIRISLRQLFPILFNYGQVGPSGKQKGIETQQ